MDETDLYSHQLAEAMLLWTQWGKAMTPQRNDKAVRDRFGEENAVKLLQTLRTLYDDFYSTEARFIADTPQDMEKLASQDFQKKHPGVAEQIVKALAWCYTFDYK